jgi:putative ABC transport system substrate-binding protein
MSRIAASMLFPAAVSAFVLAATCCQAADVLIVCDTQLKPVSEIVSGIRKTLTTPFRIVSPSEAKDALEVLVEKEDAKVVVALGKSALAEALRLPAHIPVIYDLVVVPPSITRPNTTGFYMATPTREYADLIKNHLHSIKKISVVGTRNQLNVLARGDVLQQSVFGVRNSVEFVATVRQMDESDTDAILLMPDTTLLTPAAMDEALLMSFKKKIPLLGISEQNVREGALLALVVDTVNVGKLIGEAAAKVLRVGSVGQIPPSPPRKYFMYLNASTASRMGIKLPQEMVRLAKRVYQ